MIKELLEFKTESKSEFDLMFSTLSKEHDFSQYFTLVTWGDILKIYELINLDPLSPRLQVLADTNTITPFEAEILEMLVRTNRPEIIEARKELHRKAVARTLRAVERWKKNREIDLQIAELEAKKKTKFEEPEIAGSKSLYDEVKSIWG